MVGTHVCKMAGLKRVTMELGLNAPLIVMPAADLERVADAVVISGYFNAGQACISTQRVIAHADIYGDLLDEMGRRIAAISAGDPMHGTAGVGPMIREEESARVAA